LAQIGLAKAGNARVRRGLIQLAWRFLVFQKDSALARWYRTRTEGPSGGRIIRVQRGLSFPPLCRPRPTRQAPQIRQLVPIRPPTLEAGEPLRRQQ
jgi:hypothetical protein